MKKNLTSKICRVEQNLRLIDISIKTGIQQSALSMYENGLKVPPPAHARKLNELLGKKVYQE